MTFLRITAIEDLAIPAVCTLIFFLSYTSQYLFYYIEPGPLRGPAFWWFNGSVVATWWCYDRACFVNPGPKGWVERIGLVVVEEIEEDENGEPTLPKGVRWCKKCKAVKPPRAHHCKKCERCIPKMDHHCPWTTNCVSHTTFPHFLRFILYAVLSMSQLAYQLYIRLYVLWETRNLPAYLGPPTWALAHLFLLCILNSLTLFALSILLVRAIYALATNTSQIESWEIERHEALVKRARKTGGWVYASGGQRMRVERQEFPYDVGIWRNICQGMGTANVLMWIMPFGGAPEIKAAKNWEENGFEDEGKMWPPPDPDKMPRRKREDEQAEREWRGEEEEKEAFKRRQREDYKRWNGEGDDMDEVDYESEYEEGMDGQEGWTNSEGERLRDFGVDEDADVLDEDDIPLGELLRRRKARAHEELE